MKKSSAKALKTDTATAVVVQSEDGNVCFRLESTSSGLLVQRDRRRRESRARLVQTVLFSSCDRFTRWCESDSVRFDYPIILSSVKRAGRALLENCYHDQRAEQDHEQH